MEDMFVKLPNFVKEYPAAGPVVLVCFLLGFGLAYKGAEHDAMRAGAWTAGTMAALIGGVIFVVLTS